MSQLTDKKNHKLDSMLYKPGKKRLKKCIDTKMRVKSSDAIALSTMLVLISSFKKICK